MRARHHNSKHQIPWLASLLALSLIIAFPGAQAGKVYKWVDKEGNVTYSQTAPPGGNRADAIKTKKSHVSDEDAKAQLKALTERGRDDRKSKKLIEADKEKTAELDARKAENCKAARQNLAVLKAGGRVQSKDSDGKQFYLNQDAIAQKTAQTEAQIAQFCK